MAMLVAHYSTYVGVLLNFAAGSWPTCLDCALGNSFRQANTHAWMRCGLFERNGLGSRCQDRLAIGVAVTGTWVALEDSDAASRSRSVGSRRCLLSSS